MSAITAEAPYVPRAARTGGHPGPRPALGMGQAVVSAVDPLDERRRVHRHGGSGHHRVGRQHVAVAHDDAAGPVVERIIPVSNAVGPYLPSNAAATLYTAPGCRQPRAQSVGWLWAVLWIYVGDAGDGGLSASEARRLITWR